MRPPSVSALAATCIGFCFSFDFSFGLWLRWLFTKFHAQFRTAGTQTRFSNWNSNSNFVCSGKRFKTSTWRVQLVPKTVCVLKPLPKPQLSRCFVSAAESPSCRTTASCLVAGAQFLCCCFCSPFAISLKATKCQINALCDPRSNHLFPYPVKNGQWATLNLLRMEH